MDIVFLSRIQFAFHIAFHYLFPPLTIGLSVLLVLMEGAYLITKKAIYEKMTKFWVHIFAIIFAVGVATGLVQVFAFGTNWATFSHFVGDIFGSMLGAEAIFAFFLESGFVGLLLFGWNKVSPKIHFLSTVMVSIGTHFSAVWIVTANSWMQTPAGYQIIGEGASRRAVMTNWWEMVHNPSAVERLWHVLISCWLTGAFLVLSVGAFYLLKRRHEEFARKSFVLGLLVASVMLVAQLMSGDSTAKKVAMTQPIKMAAMEGIFETAPRTPMTLIGHPNTKEKKTEGLKVPGLLSLFIYGDASHPVTGLNSFPKALWPPVGPVFQFYHIMIYMWVAMVLTTILGWMAWVKRDSPTRNRFWMKWIFFLCVFSVAFPQIANQVGWFTAEVGRQPWVVYGLLHTADGATRTLLPGQIIFSLALFVIVYALVFALFILLLDRKIKAGPRDVDVDPYRDPYKGQEV